MGLDCTMTFHIVHLQFKLLEEYFLLLEAAATFSCDLLNFQPFYLVCIMQSRVPVYMFNNVPDQSKAAGHHNDLCRQIVTASINVRESLLIRASYYFTPIKNDARASLNTCTRSLCSCETNLLIQPLQRTHISRLILQQNKELGLV